MWCTRTIVFGVAALLLAAGVSQAAAAGLVNGSVASGNFTGWTARLRAARPGGGEMDDARPGVGHDRIPIMVAVVNTATPIPTSTPKRTSTPKVSASQ